MRCAGLWPRIEWAKGLKNCEILQGAGDLDFEIQLSLCVNAVGVGVCGWQNQRRLWGYGLYIVDTQDSAWGSHPHNQNSATADSAETKWERCRCQGGVRAAAEIDRQSNKQQGWVGEWR